ncbi:MAG: hydrogenase formation protein HypD [Planctomycetota bacterium]
MIATRPADHYREIAALTRAPVALMEVCGTHTMAIARHGLRSRLPPALALLSGPGCPVCVTPAAELDRAALLAREPGVTVAIFGDLLRVPGSLSSLERERAAGADVRIVYSPRDALAMAAADRARLVVFLGAGFETTSPLVAATLVRAREEAIENFLVLPVFRLIPPAMAALAADPRARIAGFLCPGHVSTILGTRPYEGLARAHRMPCVVAGFAPGEILRALVLLLRQIAESRAEVENAYETAVRPEGNPTARALLDRVFRVADADWRGIGRLPGSGLELREEYRRHDARARIPVALPAAAPDFERGCACGAVMQGRCAPADCAHFGTECLPAHPRGPCMVSSEGACAAHWRYGGAFRHG